MTNSYDVDHGLSQDAPGPLEPVELAQQPGAAPATGNTARDQEMYGAGIRTGEDGEMPPLFHQPTHWMPLPAEPCLTCNGHGMVGGLTPHSGYDAEPCPGCTPAPSAPGDAQDERQAFEAWAKKKKMPLARIGQQYDDFWVDHAWNGWQARASVSAPAAGDALDAARWRAYAKLFPEVSASFLATHAVDGDDPLPTIKGASITGGYVVATPAGWDADNATKLRDAILRLFPVNPAHTPRPSDELAAQRKGDA